MIWKFYYYHGGGGGMNVPAFTLGSLGPLETHLALSDAASKAKMALGHLITDW